jgi:septum formation protein
MTSDTPLILASASPRRRALMSQLGIEFEAVGTNADETVPASQRPEEAVVTIAQRKLDAYLAQAAGAADRFVLAVDTEVVIGAHLYGKPGDAPAARRMLSDLAGRTHRVLSGLVLAAPGGKRSRATQESRVTLAKLSAAQIDSYVATGEPFDKAGGYAVQGQGAAFIENVDGDYSNVVGLPLRTTLRLLADAGYPLPPHLRI